MTPTIEATHNSLKLSYLRFISDSAPGLMLIFGIIISEQKQQSLSFPDDAAMKTLTAVILFLLATPLGLMINGVSHFLLGGVQHWIATRCLFSVVWPIADTHDILLVKRWQAYFGMTAEIWPEIAYEVDDLLETYMPHLAALLDHVRALKKFFRSFALLAIVPVFVKAGIPGAVAAGILLVIIFFALFIGKKKYQVAVRLIAVPSVCVALFGCKQWIVVAVALCAIAVVAMLFAGLIEFYQYGSMMLFIYQLFSRSTEPRFELSAAAVRDRLRDIVGEGRRPV